MALFLRGSRLREVVITRYRKRSGLVDIRFVDDGRGAQPVKEYDIGFLGDDYDGKEIAIEIACLAISAGGEGKERSKFKLEKGEK